MAIIWPILEKLFEVKKKYLTKAATKRLVNKSNKIESEKVAAAHFVRQRCESAIFNCK